MRILVLGAGAIGGFFGGMLVRAGVDVTFLVRPERADALARSGLRIESPIGSFSTPISVITATAVRRSYDAVLLSCKAYDLAASIEALRPAIGPDTLVVPLLNGMKHLDDLDVAFGGEKILGGTCHISVTRDADGVIRHFSPTHYALTQGPRTPAQRASSLALHTELARGGFDARFSDDIVQAMWDKWVMLATMASMTCLMRANLGEICRTTYGAEVVAATFDECCTVAEDCGHRIGHEVRTRSETLLTDRTSILAASMLRDLESGSRVEAGHIIGDLIYRAEARAIPVPNLKAAYSALEVYEARQGA